MSEYKETVEFSKNYNFKNIQDERFGSLVVVRYVGTDKHSNALWACVCDCDKEKDCRQEKYILSSSLISGDIISCGCYRKNRIKTASITHSLSSSKEYKIWSKIKERCYNKKYINYDNYGGRGIKVCDRWLESFENFYKDMGIIPSKKHSIDRIDSNGNYCPENCRWATDVEQANNRRDNIIIEYNGVKFTLSDLARKFNIKRHVLYSRINAGWTIEESLTTPVRPQKQNRKTV